jgi:hypothetical protein
VVLMARVVEPSLAAVWRVRIEREQRSGLSIQVFCEKEGVPQGTFYTWNSRRRAAGQAALLDGNRNVTSDAVPRGTRQERLVQIPLIIDLSIPVRFANGTTVHVPAARLAPTLQMLQSLQPGGTADVEPTRHSAHFRLLPADRHAKEL